MLSRLPTYAAARSGSTALPDLPAYLRRRGRRRRRRPRARPTPRCRPSSARCGPTRPTSSSTSRASRPPTPSSRTRSTPAPRCSVVLTPVEGLVIESDEVPLGDGLSLVRAVDAHRRARATCADDPHATVAVLALEVRGRPRARGRRPPPAAPADRAAPVGRRRAVARPDRLGAHRRQRLDDGPARHRPAPPERATACSRPRRRIRCARSAAWSPAARRARASSPGRCGASSSAASAPAPSRR